MDIPEVKNMVIERLKIITEDKELISEFMQDMVEINKVAKFIAKTLKELGIPITEKDKLFNNKKERESLIAFWVSLFKAYDAHRIISLNNERFCDPFQTPN